MRFYNWHMRSIQSKKLVQIRSLLNALYISQQTNKTRISYLFLFRFIGITRGKKLLFGKYQSLLKLAIFVEPQSLYKEGYFAIKGTDNKEHKVDKQNSVSFLENPDLTHNVVLIYLPIFFSSMWRVYIDLKSLDIDERIAIDHLVLSFVNS